MNLLHKTSTYQVTAQIDDRGMLSSTNDFFVGIKWHTSTHLEANYKTAKWESYGFGAGFLSSFQLVGKIQINPYFHANRYQFSGLIGTKVSPKQLLQIQIESTASPDAKMNSYKIVLRQRTPNYAPGIIISKDARGFTRHEGYLELFFY